MLVQITVGTLLMLLTLASSGASLYVIEVMLQAARWIWAWPSVRTDVPGVLTL